MKLLGRDRSAWKSTAFGLGVFVVAFLLGYKEHIDILAEFLTHGTDSLGYYQFLPVLIGQHDVLLLPYAVPMETGNHLSMFTMGVAVMQLPFFILGHVAAIVTGAPLTGYSVPYGIANIAATAFYLSAGLGMLYSTLRKYNNDMIVAISLVILFFGTNLYYYGIHAVGMSHVYSFFLLAWLVYLTIRFIEQPSASRQVALLFCGSLIVLVRQTNIVMLLFPLLYNTGTSAAIKERFRLLVRNKRGLVVGGILAATIWCIQLTYWRVTSGDWLVFTYGKMGQSFDWLHPMLIEVLFSHQNGWFIYTPVMFLVLVATIIRAAKGDRNSLLVISQVCLVWYIYASWWCWWMGGAYGHRAFVEYYALLAIPLASLVQWVMHRPLALRIIALAVFAFLVHMNVVMTDLYYPPWDGPEWTWERLFEAWQAAIGRLT